MNQIEEARKDLEAADALARTYSRKRPLDRDARIIFEKMRSALAKLEEPVSKAA